MVYVFYRYFDNHINFLFFGCQSVQKSTGSLVVCFVVILAMRVHLLLPGFHHAKITYINCLVALFCGLTFNIVPL